jgi:hypothetical protein
MVGYKKIKLGIRISLFIFNRCMVTVDDEINGRYARVMCDIRVPLETSGLCFDVLKEHGIDTLDGV